MTTREIAERLVELIREQRFIQAVEALYAADVSSRENCEPPVLGYDAVLANNRRWVETVKVERFEVPNYYVDGDTVVVEMDSDFTHVETGEKFHSEQIGVYKVRDGKITSTRFYYGYGD
ncbi:MAG: nuclear transport factor 2 family protein [Thermoanaerobaculales bacterium]